MGETGKPQMSIERFIEEMVQGRLPGRGYGLTPLDRAKLGQTVIGADREDKGEGERDDQG